MTYLSLQVLEHLRVLQLMRDVGVLSQVYMMYEFCHTCVHDVHVLSQVYMMYMFCHRCTYVHILSQVYMMYMFCNRCTCFVTCVHDV